jgi:hypothetical protein
MTSRAISRNSILLLLALVAAGCGSSKRITVDGYDDSKLNHKRVLLLYPSIEDVTMSNAAVYAASRGGATESARELLATELRTMVATELGARMDSNTVLNYLDQPVSGIVPLDPSVDFRVDGQPSEWDKLRRVGREGNVDFLIVLRDLDFNNATPSGGPRGTETVEVEYSLLDLQAGKTLANGTFSFSVDDPRTPEMTYQRLARELTKRMPFVVGG